MRRETGARGAVEGDRAMRVLEGLPTADAWPGLPERELERRRRILWQISLRILHDGPRQAAPSPERGRQFIPFAALRGYGQMIQDVERRARAGWPEEGA